MADKRARSGRGGSVKTSKYYGPGASEAEEKNPAFRGMERTFGSEHGKTIFSEMGSEFDGDPGINRGNYDSLYEERKGKK